MFSPVDRLITNANRDFFKVPKSVQQAIPIVRIYDDGIFEHPNNEFSVSFLFSDINYTLASINEKKYIFDQYSDFINTIGDECKCKITINNRKLNITELKEKICISPKGNEFDDYIREYNQMIIEAAVSKSSYVQEKYITITIKRNSIEEARKTFRHYEEDFKVKLSSVRSVCSLLSTEERLAVLHNFYREDEPGVFEYNNTHQMIMGDTFKEYICPDYMDLSDDSCIRLSDNKFVRVMFVKQLKTRVDDDFITKLTNVNREMMLSIDFESIPSEAAERFVDNIILGVESSITRWQTSQNKKNNFSAIIPPNLKREQKEARIFLDELTQNNQMMNEAIITLVLCAKSKELLDKDTEEIKSLAGNHQISTLRWEQLDGLNTVLPIGTMRQDKFRTLTTESLAIFLPFHTSNIMHKEGIFFGQHAETGNLILISKKALANGNSVIVGSSGAGKSFAAKQELLSYIFGTDADIIVVDPEREYSKMLNQLGGETIYLSETSQTYVNPMDISESYADKSEGEDIISLKSQFILSVCEQCMEGIQLTSAHKSIIDRCTRNVLAPYILNGFSGNCPTLVDLYENLLKQEEPEAKEIAISLESFAIGSSNVFAHQSNVNVDSRIVIYDLKSLKDNLRPLAMLIMMENILNKVSMNRDNNKNTYIIIDEAWLLYKYRYTAETVERLYRRVRKYGAFVTSITQNLADMLNNPSAKTMLTNSELVVILKQNGEDKVNLAKMYGIPSSMFMYIDDNAPVGSGIIKCSNQLIPFKNNFPVNTELYRMLSTKANESFENYNSVTVNSEGIV